ncbi:MAG: hypothetical protein WA373_01960 [Burkholderiales bacterium]
MKKTLLKPTLDDLADLILTHPMALKIAMDRDPGIVKRARALRVDAQRKKSGRHPEPIRRLLMLGEFQDLSQTVGKSEAKKQIAKVFSIAEGSLSNELTTARKHMRGRSLLEEIIRLMRDPLSEDVQRELQKYLKHAKQLHGIMENHGIKENTKP